MTEQQYKSELAHVARSGIPVLSARVQGQIDMDDMRVLRDVNNGGYPMLDDGSVRALRVVARLQDGDDNLIEDRNVPLMKGKPIKHRACWPCGSVDHGVAK